MRALLAATAILAAAFAIACGDGPGDGGGPEQSGGEQPALQPPAYQYAVTELDLADWLTSAPEKTFIRLDDDFSAMNYFDSVEQATELMTAWGYKGGYHTQFEPDGLYAGVVNGRYYVDVEVHLFSTFDGAHSAFEQIVASTLKAEDAEVLDDIDAHGNEHLATRLVNGTVPSSDLEAVFHRYVFRRGNLVAVVQTRGAATLMEDSYVADIAMGIDQKATGDRPIITPTPDGSGLPTPPVFDGGTPTPINQ